MTPKRTNEVMYECLELEIHQVSELIRERYRAELCGATYPLGLLPRARMNCRSKKPRYAYFNRVFRIGVTLLPNGKALLPLDGPGLPTRSMMTAVVSQYEAMKVLSH